MAKLNIFQIRRELRFAKIKELETEVKRGYAALDFYEKSGHKISIAWLFRLQEKEYELRRLKINKWYRV